jgi:hypothetical protein
MGALVSGARRLPAHHITIRVTLHDGGWAGTVCASPQENTSCLILLRIGEEKRDDVEVKSSGKRLDELETANLPPCLELSAWRPIFVLGRTVGAMQGH